MNVGGDAWGCSWWAPVKESPTRANYEFEFLGEYAYQHGAQRCGVDDATAGHAESDFQRRQYLHHATFLIADSDHLFQNLTTIDHPLTDRYVGLPCELDMTAEPLTNTLVINTLIPAKN